MTKLSDQAGKPWPPHEFEPMRNYPNACRKCGRVPDWQWHTNREASEEEGSSDA